MIAKLPTTRARRAFTATEVAAMERAGVFVGYPAAAWANDDVYRADDGTPYLFAVEQYHRMIDAALLHEDERVELIEGEVLTNMPIGDPHSNCVDLLNFTLNRLAAGRAVIRIQNPVVFAASEPQPDVSVVPYRPGIFRGRKPSAADVSLIIEVADSSLDDDLGRKAGIYADGAIPEYWVIDLAAELVHVHRGPNANGTWAAVTDHGRGASLTVAALPGISVAVAELLP